MAVRECQGYGMMLTPGLRSPDALACIFSNHLLCYPMYAVVALNSQPSVAQPSYGLSVCVCMLDWHG